MERTVFHLIAMPWRQTARREHRFGQFSEIGESALYRAQESLILTRTESEKMLTNCESGTVKRMVLPPLGQQPRQCFNYRPVGGLVDLELVTAAQTLIPM